MQDESSSEFIDAFCDAFEQAWLAGQVPELKEWLDRADVSLRPLLLPELLRVDLEYRLKNGHCDFILDEYVRKFGLEPADVSLLKPSLVSSVPGGNFETVDADTEALPAAHGTLEPRSADATLPDFGSYEVLEEIGRGGMGVVYRARHRTLGRIVALKTLPTYGAVDAETLARFRAEAEAAAHLDHPGIVPIYEVGEDRGLPWFTMGLVEGRTLRQRIRDEPFRPRDAAEVVVRIADALVYAHGRGVIHRDIKPSNVMVGANGSVKLTDFGLARLATRDVSLTATNEVIGTASYMSPEQAAGHPSAVPETADVYSVGAVLYCCLTGRPPFSGSSTIETLKQVLYHELVSVRVLNPEIPVDLETICQRCLEKDSSKRFGSAAELSSELWRFLRNEPILSRPAGRVERLWRWCQRRPQLAALVLLGMTLAMVLVVGIPFALVERTARQQAQQLATANAARAANQEYYATVQKVREQRFVRDAGWTWEALDAIRNVASLPADGKDLTELRTLTANVLTSNDMRTIQTFAQGIAPEKTASSRDGRFVALAEIRGIGECSVFVFQRQRDSDGAETLTPYRQYSMKLKPHGVKAVLGDLGFGTRVRPDGFSSVCFSHDGTRVAAGTRHGQVLEWRLEDPSGSEPILTLNTNLDTAGHLFYSRDDRRFFLLAATDYRLQIWDRETGKVVWVSDAEVHPDNCETQFVDDGAMYLVERDYGPTVVRSADEPVSRRLPWNHKAAGNIGVDPGEEILVSGYLSEKERSDWVFDLHTGEKTIRFLDSTSAKAICYRPLIDENKSTVLALTGSGTVSLLDALNGATSCWMEIGASSFPRLSVIPGADLFVASGPEASELIQIRRPQAMDVTDSDLMQRCWSVFAPSAFVISAYDISADGQRLAICESNPLAYDQRTCRFRTFEMQTGQELNRWTMRSTTHDDDQRVNAVGSEVAFFQHGLHVATQFCGHQLQLTSDGFQPTQGLRIPSQVVDPKTVSDTEIIWECLPHCLEADGFEWIQPCITLKLNDAFPLHQESLTVQMLVSGEVRKSVVLKADTFGIERPGWLLLRNEHLPAQEILENGLTIKATFSGDSLRASKQSPPARVQPGSLLLLPARSFEQKGYRFGPIAVQGDGCPVAIDDDGILVKWPADGQGSPVKWLDVLNLQTSLRDVAAAQDLCVLGTREGHVYKMLADNSVVQISNGPAIGAMGDTSDDVQCVAVTSSGHFAAAGNLNGEILLFDLTNSTSVEIARLPIHRYRMTSIALNSDASLIATAARDNTIKVWTRQHDRLQLVFQMDALVNPAVDLRFTPDDRRLFIRCERERGLRILDLPSLRGVFAELDIDW